MSTLDLIEQFPENKTWAFVRFASKTDKDCDNCRSQFTVGKTSHTRVTNTAATISSICVVCPPFFGIGIFTTRRLASLLTRYIPCVFLFRFLCATLHVGILCLCSISLVIVPDVLLAADLIVLFTLAVFCVLVTAIAVLFVLFVLAVSFVSTIILAIVSYIAHVIVAIRFVVPDLVTVLIICHFFVALCVVTSIILLVIVFILSERVIISITTIVVHFFHYVAAFIHTDTFFSNVVLVNFVVIVTFKGCVWKVHFIFLIKCGGEVPILIETI